MRFRVRFRPRGLRARWHFACSLLGLLGCGGSTTGPGEWSPVDPPPGAVAQFTALPIDVPGTLTPLGSLAPPGHVLPTNHVYFYVSNLDQVYVPDSTVHPVVAPATGTVAYLLQPVGTDWKIAFRVTKDFYYYLDHVVPTRALKVGDVIQAGEQIGVSNPGGAVDLGAYDMSRTLTGFANPARYGPETLHCVSPWPYFAEPLRAQLYARIRRAPTAPDKDGHIDLDVPGTLAGAWFDETLPIESTEGPAGWPRSVAFVTDYYDPSKVRVSIGGTIATQGVWGIPDGTPRPEAITPASGVVAYRLMYLESTTVQWGLMLVEMTDATHLRIEVFPGSQAASGSFTAAAKRYVR